MYLSTPVYMNALTVCKITQSVQEWIKYYEYVAIPIHTANSPGV